MKIETTQQSITDLPADAIVVGIRENMALTGAAADVNNATGGAVQKLIDAGEISAQAYAVAAMLAPVGILAPVVIVVGLGDADNNHPALARQASGAAAKYLATKQRQAVGFFLDLDDVSGIITGAMVGCVGQDIYRSERKLNAFETLIIATDDTDSVERGLIMGESQNLVRKLVNMPANEIFPQSFAQRVTAVGEKSGFKVEIWDEQRLEQERCGAFLAVGRASALPPRLVIMKYDGGQPDQKPIGIVGKGVTFDSGGLSIKPSAGMLDMKCDMAGAATVVGAIKAIAELKLPVNVIGFAGLAENMIAGNAYRLGDILTARNGKTIEVQNTDAEGRLVLADTLDVAADHGVEKIVDLATLTGACLVALGTDITGLMTNDSEFATQVESAAAACGESVWELPMHDEFGEMIKSSIADIRNTGGSRWGGAITAGKFLQEFVRDIPWVHLDIAGPSFADKPKSWIDGGASGCMLHTLVELVKNQR